MLVPKVTLQVRVLVLAEVWHTVEAARTGGFSLQTGSQPTQHMLQRAWHSRAPPCHGLSLRFRHWPGGTEVVQVQEAGEAVR